jgi:hypothetical protein
MEFQISKVLSLSGPSIPECGDFEEWATRIDLRDTEYSTGGPQRDVSSPGQKEWVLREGQGGLKVWTY